MTRSLRAVRPLSPRARTSRRRIRFATLTLVGAGLLLGFPAGAFAAIAPSVGTDYALSTGATTAAVAGSVIPEGQSTTYAVQYDTAASTWCTSFGSSGSPAHTTTPVNLGFTDDNYHPVWVYLPGLTAGTEYCAQLTATNGTGTAEGGQVQWTQGVPSAFPYQSYSTGATTATVEGYVDPAGQSTTYKVVYDTDASDWCTSYGASGSPAFTTSDTSLPFTDTDLHQFSVGLIGLTAGTRYCAEVVATNGSGTTPPDDGNQTSWVQGVPTADTFDVFSTGATTATVEGRVKPAGQSTTYTVVYDTAASDWCTTFSGSPTFTASDASLPFADTSFHDVSVSLTGLTAGTEYCAEIVATNGSGTSPTDDGHQTSWVQGAPSADTLDGFSTGATAATVEGEVNPAGQSTTYKVVYDTAASDWCTSSGFSGSPAHTTASTPLAFTDSSFHDVSFSLTGLTAGTEYCAEIVATNGSGTTPTDDADQTSWAQGVPIALTVDGFSAGATTATVDGQVNPAGQNTTYKVVYDTDASTWCSSGGSSGSPTHATADASLGFTDSSLHDVSVGLTGLTPGTDYCAEVVATNGTGSSPTNDGDQASWAQAKPHASTFDAVSTSTTAATVEGEVNPSGQSTTYVVQYGNAASDWCTSFGESSSPGHTTAPTSVGFTDGTFHDVSANLSALTAGTSYCGQIVATNAAGSSAGGIVQWTQGFPTASTSDGFSTASTTATVEGSVNPAGQSTTYKVVYDTAASQWCTSGGFGGSPAHTTTATSLGFTDSSVHDVSVGLTGLTLGTEYCAEVVATNGTASSPTNDGDQVVWTQTSGPPQHTLTVSKAGTGGGTVSSSPAGINCGSTCAAAFDAGSQVTLTAAAGSGSAFQGWSGGGCSGKADCVVTLNGDTAVTAVFSHLPPPVQCIVPKLKGKPLAKAKRLIKSAHCSVGKISRVKSTAKNKGHVISQRPKPGKHLPKGSKVALKVGK